MSKVEQLGAGGLSNVERIEPVRDTGTIERTIAMTIVVIILLVLLLGGGGGYYGYGRWGAGGGAGISLGTILLILLICYLLGVL